jgi:carotenoid cleavage dioxygenase
MSNRYLEGNFAPVTDEVTVADLPVTGTIPAELQGRYVRNGPNPIAPEPDNYHWFTGEGMVHGVQLRDGRATSYRNRWVRSQAVAEHLGETWPSGPVHAEMDFAANTNLIQHAGRTLAIVEAGGRPYELTYDLDTVGPCDFNGTLPNGFTAHPHRDPDTGELHAVAYWWGLGNAMQYLVVGADGTVRRAEQIEFGEHVMVHDFGLGERHVLFLDLPVVFDVELAMKGTGLPYRWREDYQARIGVMPREGGNADVQWFDVDPCYIFHPMNVWEDGDRIVLDACRHGRMFASDLQGPNEGPPTLSRWTFDLAGGKVIEEVIDDRGQEFPRFDERLQGKSYRYGYSVGVGHDFAIGGIIRHDLAADTSVVRRDPHHEWGEVVFVPRSEGAAEDDGWLIGYRYDREADRSDLVILDAADVSGDAVAEIRLPRRVPNGFHGNWLPDEG